MFRLLSFIGFQIVSFFCTSCLNSFGQATVETSRQSQLEVWQGHYFATVSDESVYQLSVSQLNGFALKRVTIDGDSLVCSGKILLGDGEISLLVADDAKLHSALSPVMIICRHGDKSYLVPKDRIHGFCLDFADDSKNTMEFYFCKQRQNAVTISKELELPIRYRDFIQLPELTGNVFEIRKDGTRFVFFVSLGGGANLFEGMRFCSSSKKLNVAEINSGYGSRTEVTQVEFRIAHVLESFSIATQIEFGNVPIAKLGTMIKTARAPWPGLIP
jgi:hypothetical protein